MTGTTTPLIALAAGGTGGHMFPAEALARALLARNARVALITDKRGQAFGEALPSVTVHRIRAARLRRNAADRVRAVIEMGLGGLQAGRLLRELSPAAVVGFGGYPSMPTIVAASWAGLPIVLHEQNALLGRANRRLAHRARIVATSFAGMDGNGASGLPAGVAARLTGNPVRPGVLAVREQPYKVPLPDGPHSILVMGGSQGARIFSEIIPQAVALLPETARARLGIVQQCRPEDIDLARAAFAEIGVSAELSSFFTDMPARFAACQLVITRSGASTVAELGVAGRPAILVPYPFATDDHQTANATAFAASGAGWVLNQRSLTPQALAERIQYLLSDPETLARAAAAARSHGRPDAADRLADLVIDQIVAGKRPATSTFGGLAA